MTRALACGFALGLLASLGCNPTVACTPQNCSGCCDEADVCRPGNAADACGLGGAACISCGDSVCNPNGTCFSQADGAVVGPTDDGGLPFTEDGGLVAQDAGATTDAGAPTDAGTADAGGGDAGRTDAGATDAGSPDSGLDAGVDAGVFLPRDSCDVPADVSGLDAGQFWADRPVVDFSAGRVLLAFNAHQVSAPATRTLTTRLFENGAWGQPVPHETDNSVFLWQDELALDPLGNAALAWSTGLSAGRRVYSQAAGSWATVPWTTAPLLGERIRLLWSTPGAFFQGWFNLSTPQYATASPGGFTSDESVSSATEQAIDLAVGRMSDGEVAVVWRDTNRLFRGRFIQDGNLKRGGEAEHAEPPTAALIGRPAIGALPNGHALVIWERRSTNGTVELMAMELQDEVAQGDMQVPLFGAPTVLAQTTSAQSYGQVQLVVDAGGDATVTWQDLNGSTWALRRLGGTWGTPVQLGAAGLAHNRRAVMDAQGHVTVALFNNATDFRVQLRRIARGSSTWGPAYFATPDTTGAAALALTGAGEPMVFYRENSGPSPIRVTTCR
jgi:hypothetical protein